MKKFVDTGVIGAVVDLSEIQGVLKKLRSMPEIADPIVKQVAQLLQEQAVAKSPVDGGWFKSEWTPITQFSGLGSYTFTNLSPYGHVLEKGLYPGVGPKTVRGAEGGIFSSQAVGGILAPIAADAEKQINIIDLLIQALEKHMRE